MLKILNRERLLVSLNDVSNILPTSTNIHIRQYNINLMRLIHHYNLVIKNNDKKSNNSNIAIYDHERKLLLYIRDNGSVNKKLKFLPITRNFKMTPRYITEFIKVLFALHPQYYVTSVCNNNLKNECYSELRRFICNNVIVDDKNLLTVKQVFSSHIDELKLIIMSQKNCISQQGIIQNIIDIIPDERYINCLTQRNIIEISKRKFCDAINTRQYTVAYFIFTRLLHNKNSCCNKILSKFYYGSIVQVENEISLFITDAHFQQFLFNKDETFLMRLLSETTTYYYKYLLDIIVTKSDPTKLHNLLVRHMLLLCKCDMDIAYRNSKKADILLSKFPDLANIYNNLPILLCLTEGNRYVLRLLLSSKYSHIVDPTVHVFVGSSFVDTSRIFYSDTRVIKNIATLRRQTIYNILIIIGVICSCIFMVYTQV